MPKILKQNKFGDQYYASPDLDISISGTMLVSEFNKFRTVPVINPELIELLDLKLYEHQIREYCDEDGTVKVTILFKFSNLDITLPSLKIT